jgi:hypothetical protein
MYGFSHPYYLVVADTSPGGSLYEYTVGGDHLVTVYMKPRTTFLRPAMTFKVVDWSEYSYDALLAMRPKFSDLSLANDVLELRQIVDLAKPFGTRARRLDGERPTWRDYVAGNSNSYLWKRFGVDPLLNSVVEVTKLMRKMASTISDIRKRANRLQTRHYARPIDLNSTNLPSDGDVYTEQVGNFRETRLFRECRWVHKPIYHATLKFKYDVSRLTDAELGVRAWMEASGLDNPIGVLWNAIPYSFVVDWFVNIGDWAESLIHEPAIPIVIEDFSHSVKYSYRTDIRMSWLKGKLTFPLASNEVSFYERRRDIPSTTSRIRFRIPDLGSFVLGAALVGQTAKAYQGRSVKRPPATKWLRFDNRTLLR